MLSDSNALGMSARDKFTVFDFISDDDASGDEDQSNPHSSSSSGEEPSYSCSDEEPRSEEVSNTYDHVKGASNACRPDAGMVLQ